MPPLLADFIHNRVCELKCEKFLTRPGVAVKMPLPPGKAREFEAARKQDCLRGVEPQAQDWFHQQTGRI